MEPLNLKNIVFGKAWQILSALLTVAVIAIGFHDLKVSGDRDVLEQTVKTRDANLSSKVNEIQFIKAWMERDKLDAIAKEAEYNRTMAAKPKYVTQIKYVPTGDKCADLNAIAEEARKNAEGIGI